MSRKFYVYVYFDPETMEPFYVGKGFGNRDRVHLSETRCWDGIWRPGKNASKMLRIKDLWKRGLEPLIQRVFFTDIEDEALKEEARLVSLWKDKVTNLTEGGYGGLAGERNGMYNRTHSEETKAKLRAVRAQEKLDPNYTKNKVARNPRSTEVTDGTNTYPSISEAARSLNIGLTAARNMLKRGQLYYPNTVPNVGLIPGTAEWSHYRAAVDKRSRAVTDGTQTFPSINAAAKHYNIHPATAKRKADKLPCTTQPSLILDWI